jgi:hypothetical protein
MRINRQTRRVSFVLLSVLGLLATLLSFPAGGNSQTEAEDENKLTLDLIRSYRSWTRINTQPIIVQTPLDLAQVGG